MIALGEERSFDQDPAFALRMMVDIANRAPSPAVNDPTTAVQVLDHIGEVLGLIGRTDLEQRTKPTDADTPGAVVMVTPRWELRRLDANVAESWRDSVDLDRASAGDVDAEQRERRDEVRPRARVDAGAACSPDRSRAVRATRGRRRRSSPPRPRPRRIPSRVRRARRRVSRRPSSRRRSRWGFRVLGRLGPGGSYTAASIPQCSSNSRSSLFRIPRRHAQAVEARRHRVKRRSSSAGAARRRPHADRQVEELKPGDLAQEAEVELDGRHGIVAADAQGERAQLGESRPVDRGDEFAHDQGCR